MFLYKSIKKYIIKKYIFVNNNKIIDVHLIKCNTDEKKLLVKNNSECTEMVID